MADGNGRTKCEVYSRVVGFLSPLSQWNKGKKEEFRDRRTFDGVRAAEAGKNCSCGCGK